MKIKLLRFFKRLFIGLSVFSLIIYTFKDFLYQNLIHYKEIDQRPLVRIDNKSIQSDLDFWMETSNTAGVDQIVDFAMEYATEDLTYTFGKCSVNPNTFIMGNKKTNCIGYSASLHAVLTYLLEKKDLLATVKSEHKVGQLYFCGYNIHRLFKDPAFKDHDYNVITDKNTHKRYVIDPTVRVNLGIKSINEQH